jgi:hypothetical protein
MPDKNRINSHAGQPFWAAKFPRGPAAGFYRPKYVVPQGMDPPANQSREHFLYFFSKFVAAG